MTTPMSAFAMICESVAGIDPGDLRAIDDFFLQTLKTLDEPVREILFDWALTLDREPTEVDREVLNAQLSAIGFKPHGRSAQRETPVDDDDRQCA